MKKIIPTDDVLNKIRLLLFATFLSWKKWDKIIKGEESDKGDSNCELCNFCDECNECPLDIINKKCSDRESPYYKWAYHIIINHIPKKTFSEAEITKNQIRLRLIPIKPKEKFLYIYNDPIYNFRFNRSFRGIFPICPTCIEYAREMRKILFDLKEEIKDIIKELKNDWGKEKEIKISGEEDNR